MPFQLNRDCGIPLTVVSGGDKEGLKAEWRRKKRWFLNFFGCQYSEVTKVF